MGCICRLESPSINAFTDSKTIYNKKPSSVDKEYIIRH